MTTGHTDAELKTMDKRRTLDELVEECGSWRREGKTVVWTNGCFDLFHAGHVRALDTAAGFGDVLIVGLNSDASIRRLKGEGRPICDENDRAEVLSALEAVTRVLVFDSVRCDRELAALKPEVWTKSGDYTPESLDPAEREAVLSNGGRIEITPLIPGVSTTLLVKKIRRQDPEKIVSAACALIRDGTGRQLMVATRYADAVKWSLPGGGHTHGETLVDTARRETREETGIEVDIVRHMGVIERIEPAWGLHLALHLFEARPRDPDMLQQEMFAGDRDSAIEQVAWFDRERLRDEPGVVLGRRIWLEHGAKDDKVWPPYIFMPSGEE